MDEPASLEDVFERYEALPSRNEEQAKRELVDRVLAAVADRLAAAAADDERNRHVRDATARVRLLAPGERSTRLCRGRRGLSVTGAADGSRRPIFFALGAFGREPPGERHASDAVTRAALPGVPGAETRRTSIAKAPPLRPPTRRPEPLRLRPPEPSRSACCRERIG